MAWRLARSLEALRKEINALAPNRSKASDGTIGDTAHSSRASDHNPNAAGVVCALDLTHDPAHGVDGHKLADALVACKDPRIKYIIWNRRICSGGAGPQPWKWRAYAGKNPHNHHIHISVGPKAAQYDDDGGWILARSGFQPVAKPDAPPVEERSVLKKGASGPDVEALQRALVRSGAMLTVDGDFGAKTEAALKAFQRKAKLVPDGIAGTYTWKALGNA